MSSCTPGSIFLHVRSSNSPQRHKDTKEEEKTLPVFFVPLCLCGGPVRTTRRPENNTRCRRRNWPCLFITMSGSIKTGANVAAGGSREAADKVRNFRGLSSRGPKGPVAISDADIHTNMITGSYCVRDCHGRYRSLAMTRTPLFLKNGFVNTLAAAGGSRVFEELSYDLSACVVDQVPGDDMAADPYRGANLSHCPGRTAAHLRDAPLLFARANRVSPIYRSTGRFPGKAFRLSAAYYHGRSHRRVVPPRRLSIDCTCRMDRECVDHDAGVGCMLLGDGAAEIDGRIARHVTKRRPWLTWTGRS